MERGHVGKSIARKVVIAIGTTLATSGAIVAASCGTASDARAVDAGGDAAHDDGSVHSACAPVVNEPVPGTCCGYRALPIPEPLEWVPCGSDAGADCMRTSTAVTVGAGHVTTDGRVLFVLTTYERAAFQQGAGGQYYATRASIAAEADGRVLQAFAPERCRLEDVDLEDEGVVWAMVDFAPYPSVRSVAVAWRFGGEPQPIRIATSSSLFAPGWATGRHVLYEYGGSAGLLLDWDGGVRTVIDGGPSGPAPVVREDVVIGRRGSPPSAIARWKPTDGVRDLVVGDAGAHGARSLVTDGVDMVWFEQTSVAETPVALMVSPFATDAEAVRARLLANVAAGPLVVGCGHAAVSSTEGVRIFRFSDGASWTVPRSDPRRRLDAHVLTCTEIFIAEVPMALPGIEDGPPYLQRRRLDALGAPEPAN